MRVPLFDCCTQNDSFRVRMAELATHEHLQGDGVLVTKLQKGTRGGAR